MRDSSHHTSPWITVTTAAKLNEVSRQAMDRRARLGHIRTNNIDGRMFVHRDDVATLKPRHRHKDKKTQKLDDIRLARIIELYEQGQSMAAVGDQFSISRERVRQILDKAGVKRRGGGPPPSDKTIADREKRRTHAPNLRTFVELVGRLVTQLENDRSVEIKPGPTTLAALKESVETIQKELNRIEKIKRRPKSDPKNTEATPLLREKLRRQEADAVTT